jgi:hypothetical protein
LAFVTVLLAPRLGAARTFAVSPTGTPDAAGTEQAPMELAAAIGKAQAGDVVRVAPGTYTVNQTLRLQAKGTDKKPIRFESAGAERAVLDFAAQTEDKDNKGIEITGDFWQVTGIEVAHAGGYGIYITGSHNTLERCVARENRLTGMQIDVGGSYNLFSHCESFRNFDPKTRGEDADGFAVKHAVGLGNVFRGCRSYQNADDGWDLWMSPNPVVIEDCVSFRNGFNTFGIKDFQGDGNGYKLGGNYIDVAHVVRRSVAIENPLNGFDQNHNLGPITIEDSVAVRCGRGFSMPEAARSGHITLRGNISFGSQNILEPHLVGEANHWYPDIAAGKVGPPPRPGHRDVPGAGPVPTTHETPVLTDMPKVLAPVPVPLKAPPNP